MPASPAATFTRALSTTLHGGLRNLAETPRGKKQILTVALDIVICWIALWGAYSLRYGRAFTDLDTTAHLFALLPPLTVIVFAGLGVYRWVVRSISARLIRQLFKGSVISSVLLVLVVFLLPPDRVTPRSLIVIYGMLLMLGSAGARLLWQRLFDAAHNGEPIAIYGAGEAGQRLASLLRAADVLHVVAFIDDDPGLHGKTVDGVRVFAGADERLASELRRRDVSRVVLAMPSVGGAGYNRALARLGSGQFAIQTLPSFSDLVSGKANPVEIRDVSIKDILGRQEVLPDRASMAECVTGKHVLVTGGGGSIGAELCRQIVELAPERLVIVDSCESNLYAITEELDARFAEIGRPTVECFLPRLLSVTDRRRVRQLFAEQTIDVVFHAAAYKHVPIVEHQPEQGVETNIFGTLNVLEAAIDHKIESLTLISTDKAVRPTNAMGASKRVAELLLQAAHRDGVATRLSMVRFGNVLGSSGSVVPKFRQQILDGGPITLTHGDITRYFMTVSEASQLVLQAASIAEGGEVFVLDMGEPVRIVDLARSMVHLYGRRLRSVTGDPADIEIRIDGLRAGEKLHEELFLGNDQKRTHVSKILKADEAHLSRSMLDEVLGDLKLQMRQSDPTALRARLLEIARFDETPLQTSRIPSRRNVAHPPRDVLDSVS